jgi:hypothetical protein
MTTLSECRSVSVAVAATEADSVDDTTTALDPER